MALYLSIEEEGLRHIWRQDMSSANRLAVAFAIGLSAVFASEAFAQPDVNPPPPLTGHGPALTAQRKAALMKCTNGIKFDSDRYVNCMTKAGEAP
jgi:hypothetical protein